MRKYVTAVDSWCVDDMQLRAKVMKYAYRWDYVCAYIYLMKCNLHLAFMAIIQIQNKLSKNKLEYYITVSNHF